MVYEDEYKDEPCFVISIAARMVGLHAQTLRYYERVGLIWPSRSVGRQRLYSPADIERLRKIKTFTDEMGLNLAGAEVALKLVDRIEELEREVRRLTDEVTRLRSHLQLASRQVSNTP
ncbi:MAG TPA: MerR family transcriptional regulator [Dehalococcoidia bacterium]|jgi:MerR family transcriptional regulator/heat shock protein HspR|nr:MerR family transcriptional regulator [Dehalococcoidia bacterium]